LVIPELPLSIVAFEAMNQSIDILRVGPDLVHLRLYKCKVFRIVGLVFHPDMSIIDISHCSGPYPSILINKFIGIPVFPNHFRQIVKMINDINREQVVRLGSQLNNIRNTAAVNTDPNPSISIGMFTNGSNYARRITEFMAHL
jgi:hypothetical protein